MGMAGETGAIAAANEMPPRPGGTVPLAMAFAAKTNPAVKGIDITSRVSLRQKSRLVDNDRAGNSILFPVWRNGVSVPA